MSAVIRFRYFYPILTKEPLWDEDIIARLEYAKVKMLKTGVALSTNVSELALDKALSLCNLVDGLIFYVAATNKQDFEEIMPELKFEQAIGSIKCSVNYGKDRVKDAYGSTFDYYE